MHKNSVLLDGVIVKKPEYSESEKQCTFSIRSVRFYKDGSVVKKKENIFSVIATGKTAKTCSTKNKGTLVQIGGTLETDENNAVFVETDNIQYLPNK